MESAQEALQQVMGNYKQHAFQARAIAEEYFDSKKVLNQLLNNIYNHNTQQHAKRNFSKST